MLSRERFLSIVDHTILAPDATADVVERFCRAAVEHSTWSVCVNGFWVPLAAETTEGSDTGTCAVVGFPLGAGHSDARAREAELAVAEGASEIDLTINIGLILGGQVRDAGDDIERVADAIGSDVLLKVILESALLDDEQITAACRVAVDAGADFVKTSTGFNPAGGATVDAVRLMRASVADDVGVCASGGIRSLDQAEAMVNAGATRLGLSRTEQILGEITARDLSSRDLRAGPPTEPT